MLNLGYLVGLMMDDNITAGLSMQTGLNIS
jgi:hypothetical protein